MLKKRIIPCLDVKDGRVVKGVNFVNLTDVGDPVDSARAYYEAGCDELVFLDITATSDNRETTVDMVRRVADQVFDLEMLNRVAEVVDVPIIASGGAGNIEDIVEVFEKTTATGALAASIFHFGEVNIGETKQVLANAGIEVRR